MLIFGNSCRFGIHWLVDTQWWCAHMWQSRLKSDSIMCVNYYYVIRLVLIVMCWYKFCAFMFSLSCDLIIWSCLFLSSYPAMLGNPLCRLWQEKFFVFNFLIIICCGSVYKTFCCCFVPINILAVLIMAPITVDLFWMDKLEMSGPRRTSCHQMPLGGSSGNWTWAGEGSSEKMHCIREGGPDEYAWLHYPASAREIRSKTGMSGYLTYLLRDRGGWLSETPQPSCWYHPATPGRGWPGGGQTVPVLTSFISVVRLHRSDGQDTPRDCLSLLSGSNTQVWPGQESGAWASPWTAQAEIILQSSGKRQESLCFHEQYKRYGSYLACQTLKNWYHTGYLGRYHTPGEVMISVRWVPTQFCGLRPPLCVLTVCTR